MYRTICRRLNRSAITVALLIMLLLVLGARGCNTRPPVPIYTEEDVRTGTAGLSMYFVKDMPPVTIDNGSEFMIGIDLWNLGATDVSDAVIKFVNTQPNYISFDEPLLMNGIALEGKSVYNIEGGYKMIELHGENQGIPYEKEASFIFKTYACYKYQTVASSMLCINPYTTAELRYRDVPCQLTPLNMGAGQGGPVAVTKIEPKLIKINSEEHMELKIFIKNAGLGKVTTTGKFDYECTRRSTNLSDFKDIQSSVQVSTDITADCKTTFSQEQSSTILLRCTFPIDKSKGVFQTPIVVTLDYGYRSPDLNIKMKVIDPYYTES